jgi:hypothetical protein
MGSPSTRQSAKSIKSSEQITKGAITLKRLIRKLIPIVLIVAVILPSSSAFAKPIEWYNRTDGTINGMTVYKDMRPNTILLREETPIYADPGDAEPIAALSPQILNYVIAFEFAPNRHPDADRWYYIDTWLGNAWIHPHRAIPNYFNVEGKGETTKVVDFSKVPYYNSTRNNMELYTDPFYDAKITWASLAPQDNIEVVAKAGFQYMYQIKTWIGLYWIRVPPSPPRI